jgi:tetratricopeptide (TPR) repeat protein
MDTTNQESLRLRQLALDAMWQGSFEEAIDFYDAANAVAETDDVRELITIGKAEALIACERDGAEITALPAIVMRRRTPRHVYLAAYALMRKHNEGDDRRRALFYGEIARDAAAELGEAFSRAKVLNTMGIILTAESRFRDAIESFDMSLAALSQVSGRENEVAFSRVGILANLAGAKVLGGDITEGIDLLSKVLPRLEDDYSRTEAVLDLCFAYIELERYAEAEFLGIEALELATVGRQIRNANHMLGEIMVRTGRSEEAEGYFSVVAGFYPDYKNVKELLFTVDLCAVVNWKG